MTKEQFDLWKDVSSTIRLDEQGSVHLIDRTNNVLVMILWAHRGIHEYSSIQTKNDTRFLVKVHQGEDLSSIQPELVERAFDVQKYDHLLVNCKEPNHAILYSISLEPSNRVFKLSIELHPELGHSIISEAEKNKIEINYQSTVQVVDFYRQYPDHLLMHGISPRGAIDSIDRTFESRADYSIQGSSRFIHASSYDKLNPLNQRLFATSGLIVKSGEIWYADREDTGMDEKSIQALEQKLNFNFSEILNHENAHNEFIIKGFKPAAIFIETMSFENADYGLVADKFNLPIIYLEGVHFRECKLIGGKFQAASMIRLSWAPSGEINLELENL